MKLLITKYLRFIFLRPVEYVKKHWKLTLGVLLVVLLFGYFQYQKAQKAKPILTFAHPKYQDLVKTLEVSGVVDAKEKARLRFVAGGKVIYLGANEGEWVKKGQTIAKIDEASLKKQMEQSLNNYMKERLDWENTRDDVKDRWIDTQEKRSVDQNQLDLNNQVLNVEIANIAISNSSIYAPFAGVLTISPTHVSGVQLLATDYFELVNPKSLVFKATVDESDIALVSASQSATVTLDAFPDEDIQTAISYIAFTSSQTSSGTVFVVELPLAGNDLNRYRLGMNGDASIKVDERKQVLSVPLDAIKDKDGKTYVSLKTGKDTTEDKEITVGMETEDQVEVLSGLSESDEILIPE